jgi:hypothetical protein
MQISLKVNISISTTKREKLKQLSKIYGKLGVCFWLSVDYSDLLFKLYKLWQNRSISLATQTKKVYNEIGVFFKVPFLRNNLKTINKRLENRLENFSFLGKTHQNKIER